MKLYILKPKEKWDPWYDKCFGMVVRASNPRQARLLASKGCGAEEEEVWMNPDYTSCSLLKDEGPSGIVMRDIHAA